MDAVRDDIAMTSTTRGAGVSMWKQIAETLQGEIADGIHAPGARLPTEMLLAERFGVNRHTARRAVEELSRDGLVRVEQGRGSFVAEDVLEYAIGSRARFSEWIRRHNREPSGQVLELGEAEADAEVAAALGLRRRAGIIRMERLGLADGRPVSLGTHHFPAERFAGLLAGVRAHATITEALAEAGVTDYRRRVTRVSARMPLPREAQLLMLARNRPVLVSESIDVDQHDAVVGFGVARYPTPRVQLVFEPTERS